MAAASVETCRFVVLWCPRGRLGSVLDVRKRRRRVRGRFHRWIQISTGPQQCADLYHDPPKFSIQSSLGSSKYGRMRRRRLPDPRPIPEGVREPIYIRKKCAIWTRWRPVPGKNANYPRAPSSRRSGRVGPGPYTTPKIASKSSEAGRREDQSNPIHNSYFLRGETRVGCVSVHPDIFLSYWPKLFLWYRIARVCRSVM